MKKTIICIVLTILLTNMLLIQSNILLIKNMSLVNAEEKVALKDRDCQDCTKYATYKINSKQWYICGVKQPDLRMSPIIYNNKTYCPLRQVPELLGYDITYNTSSRAITIYNDYLKVDIVMQIDNYLALVNGEEVQIDEKNTKITPIVKNGSTLLPLKFLFDTFCVKYEWYPQTKSITFEYTDYSCIKPLKFKLYDTEDKLFNFSEYKDKPVFIDFSASWCQPCWEAYPMLKELHQKYSDRFLFLTIMPEEMPEVKNEKEVEKIPWTLLSDPESKTASSICAPYVPTFVLLDKEHNIKEKFVGYDKEKSLEILTKAFEDLLK